MSEEKKSSKGPMIALVAGVIALGAGGVVYVTQQSKTVDAPAEISSTATEDTSGVEDIAPAAAEQSSKPADTQPAETDSAAGTVPGLKMGDPVVAKIGGQDVLRSEVFNYITTLPEQIRQMPLQNLFPLALDQVLNNRIIGEKADAAKLDADPEVTKILDQAKGQIVRNVYVERELNKAVSQKELLKAYETMLSAQEKVEEVHARHILVADESKARDIIAKLNDGAKFEDLAKESTDGPTAANGGDLGYFAKAEMVPEFAEAAFSIAPGSVSKDPVKTQFGWHVIKVEEKRQRPEPQFETVKPQLEAQIRREKLNTMLETWQKESKIEKFDINGEAIKAEPAKKN